MLWTPRFGLDSGGNAVVVTENTNGVVVTENPNDIAPDNTIEVVVTDNTKVMSSTFGETNMFTWVAASHEEADDRMMIHIVDMIKSGISKITVRATDTDVIIILLAFMLQFYHSLFLCGCRYLLSGYID